MKTKTALITSDDGRTLRIAEAGDPYGIPLFLHGGTPGAYVFPASFIADAEANGIRLISHNRPGYGDSTPLPGRCVADVAKDVAAIAQHLGISRLVTLGASGGGPHALACAVLLPNLVAAAVAMESPAPFDAQGLDWFAGLDEGTTAEFHAAAAGREAFTAFVAVAAPGMLNATLEDMIAGFRSMSQAAKDEPVLEAVARWFFDASREALKNGNEGWIEDDLAFCTPWGFGLAHVRVPVLVMHGEQDTMVNIGHGRWLAGHIPGAEARFYDGENHGTLFERQYPAAREWLVGKMK